MKHMPADKALYLVRRYARIQSRIGEWKRKVSLVFDECEQPIYEGDQLIGSGCMHELRAAKAKGEIKCGPDGESNFWHVIDSIGFCRSCRLGLRAIRHHKRTLKARRSGVLAAIKRLGSKS